MVNLKDMQYLIQVISETDTAMRQIETNGKYPKHLHDVVLKALANHRMMIISEFENRHNINIEV